MSNELIAGIEFDARETRLRSLKQRLDYVKKCAVAQLPMQGLESSGAVGLLPPDREHCDCGSVLIKNTSLLLEGRLFCPKCLTACDRSTQPVRVASCGGASVDLEG